MWQAWSFHSVDKWFGASTSTAFKLSGLRRAGRRFCVHPVYDASLRDADRRFSRLSKNRLFLPYFTGSPLPGGLQASFLASGPPIRGEPRSWTFLHQDSLGNRHTLVYKPFPFVPVAGLVIPAKSSDRTVSPLKSRHLTLKLFSPIESDDDDGSGRDSARRPSASPNPSVGHNAAVHLFVTLDGMRGPDPRARSFRGV
jgi:hypothetical protein